MRARLACLPTVKSGAVLAAILSCSFIVGYSPGAGHNTIQTLPPGSVALVGAGSTFDSVLFKSWFATYRYENPAVYVAYDSVGSSEGVRRFMGSNVNDGEKVDFGASDAAMKDNDIARVKEGVLMLPITAGGVVLAYNIPGLQGELRLSRRAYAGIFLGEITNWNDQRIAESNPGVKLPSLTIATVVRRDGSGTTFAFTNNLSAINDEWRTKYGASNLVDWPGLAMRAPGNEGVAGRIEQSVGSIGYVEYGFAQALGLKMAVLENKDGQYVKASGLASVAALAHAEMPDNLRTFVADPSGSDSYPIVTFSWVLLRKDNPNSAKAKAMQALFSWCLLDGQRYAPIEGYVPLPAAVVQKGLAALGNPNAANLN